MKAQCRGRALARSKRPGAPPAPARRGNVIEIQSSDKRKDKQPTRQWGAPLHTIILLGEQLEYLKVLLGSLDKVALPLLMCAGRPPEHHLQSQGRFAPGTGGFSQPRAFRRPPGGPLRPKPALLCILRASDQAANKGKERCKQGQGEAPLLALVKPALEKNEDSRQRTFVGLQRLRGGRKPGAAAP